MSAHPQRLPAAVPGAIAAALLLLITIAGCSEKLPRVLIIGLDGADLRQVERLSRQGRLPNLQGLIERGVSGPLETVSAMSPVAWTSVATGVRPAKHGINAYVFIDPARSGRPISAVDRRRPAFWNVLSHYDRSVGVIGWWVTFPAERVNGYLVSPYLHFHPVAAEKTAKVSRPWDDLDPRRTHPPELAQELRSLIYSPGDLTAELGELNAGVIPGQTAWAWARDLSALDIALHQMQRAPVETLAVYLQAIDVSSHDFTLHVYGGESRPPADARVEPDERLRALALVESIYAKTDVLIGRLVQAAGPGADVIVLSDHGWDYDGTGHLAAQPGIFVAAGPSFAARGRLEHIHMLDVLPTLLRLLAVPLSKRLDGEVATDALERSVPPAVWVDRWPIPPVALADDTDPEAAEDAHMFDLLRELGYIERAEPE